MSSLLRVSWRHAARASLRKTAVASRSFVTRTANVVKRAAPVGLRHSSTATKPQPTTSDVPEPTVEDTDVEHFSSLEGNVDARLVKALTVSPFQYATMSPVQARILPRLPDLVAPREQGNPKSIDLLVKARTGTGKTIGFLVPAIEARIRELEAIAAQPSSQTATDAVRARGSASRRYAMENVGALVISPTRELASQIAVEAQKLTSHIPGFGVSLFVGGLDKFRQMSHFTGSRKDIVVATPGRLKDFLMDDRSGVREALKNTKMLILDEADTLLDMGFRDDIEYIMNQLPSNESRHTFLFSATVSKGIQQIANEHLNPDHEFINCVSEDTSEVHDHIPQYHTILPGPEHQIPHLLRLIMQDQLEHGPKSKVVLFLPTTKMTMLTTNILFGLARQVFPERATILELHSKKTMNARQKAAENFRNTSRASVLVTSDVSARGVDYPGVTRVIQLGLPKSAEQYVHRVGRTGRGSSKTGRGDLVLLDWEHEYVRRNFTHLPLKPLAVADYAAEVKAHIETAAPPAVKEKMAQMNEEMERAVGRYLRTKADQAEIGEAMMSMIGFYASLSSGLKLDVDGIAEALKKWSTVGMGLEKAPYVGSAFLARLGGGRPERRSGGSDRFGERRFGEKREWRTEGGASGFQRRNERSSSTPPWAQRRRSATEDTLFGGERSFGGGFERSNAKWGAPERSVRRTRSFGDEAGEDGAESGYRSKGHVGRRTRSWEAKQGRDGFEF